MPISGGFMNGQATQGGTLISELSHSSGGACFS
jgi:hypothetical protein